MFALFKTKGINVAVLFNLWEHFAGENCGFLYGEIRIFRASDLKDHQNRYPPKQIAGCP